MCSDISVTHSVGPQPGGYPFTGKSNTGKPAWGTSQAGLMSTPKMDLVVLLSGYTPSLRQRVLYLDVNRLRDPCGGARVNRPWVDSSPCTPYKIGPRSLTICNPSLMQKQLMPEKG